MEFDSLSQGSDEGVELSVSNHGINFPHDFNFGDDHLPEFLEAKVVYLILPKCVPISRATRLQWLLDHLNKTVTISSNKAIENSQTIEVISALPREQNMNITSCVRFLVTYRTELKFIAHSYRFVFCLDMSPSHANVDIDGKELLFDQILERFKTSIEGLSKRFTIPGNSLVFQPCIYLTILANTPFFITPAQQVILKGIQMTPGNVNEIIRCVEKYFHMLEGKIAEVCVQALEKLDQQQKTIHEDNLHNDFLDIPEGCFSKIPMVTPDANFVNMLRYSMLAVCLLPENTLSHILVITDGIVSMPDSNVMETMLHQLHYDSVSVSFLKVGSSSHPHSGAGLVPYIDLLRFFAQSTLGTCIECFPKITHCPNLSLNFYQETVMVWSFHSSYNSGSIKSCDNPNSWTSINDRFYNQRLPTLLSKRQTEDNTTASLSLLLARRMREGFTVENIFYMNGNLEIKLIHQWKASIFIHYKLSSLWPPTKNQTHFEVVICAPYEFLHDMTCLIKKETKSVFRQAIIQRFWSRLSQMSSGDSTLGILLSNLTKNKNWCTLPDSVKNGLPVFTTNNSILTDSTRLILIPRDNYCVNFVSIWQGISQLETNHWRKWFPTHKISLILTHDSPLPTSLHTSTCSSQRYQVVQCRQAVVALYGMLSGWASFALIDNHTYLRFIYSEHDKVPFGFCIIRVSSKFPSAVLNLGFSTNTAGQIRYQILDELKAELSSLSYIPKATEPSCCVLLQKPLEKILIRYERVPNTYTTVVFPDGTQPPDINWYTSPVTGSLFTTLSRYLFHKRWIWSANYAANPRLSDTSVSRILNTLTRMRLKEGYHFAYSSSGIMTMVLELQLEPNASCVVQYVSFPPYYNWGDDFLTASDEEGEPISEIEAELQMITEVWIEPQYGKVVSSNPRIKYFNNMNYYQIAEAIRLLDSRCINVLLTMEHISLMCQNKAVHNLSGDLEFAATGTSVSKRSCSRKNSRQPCDYHCPAIPKSGSPWYPISTPRIEHIPFKFNPISLLHLCQQTELLFSMLREERTNKTPKTDKANKLLLDNLFEHFSLLHDRELELSKEESDSFTNEIFKRHRNEYPHTCPISEKDVDRNLSYKWKCYIKGVSVTHVILTFLPASVDDLRALTGVSVAIDHSDEIEADERSTSRNSNISDVPINTPNILCLPVYVYDCPLKLLVNAYVENGNGKSCAMDDVYLDHRFKCFSNQSSETKEKFKGSDTESYSEETYLPDSRNVMEHCNALEMTHAKCFALSLFLALHVGIYVHNSDVQNAMDLCEEDIKEIDITDYIVKVCSHARHCKSDNILTQTLNEAYPCSEVKNLHMLIKKKFFKTICTCFNQVPSNGEYYFFRHLCIQPEEKVQDSDDEMSIAASEIEFRSERDASMFSEGPHLLPKGLNTGFIDVASMSDVSPLFLHFVCTLRYNNGGHSNTSVRVLPTCLGELTQTLEKPTEFVDKSKLQVTLDIFCLSLPSRVQNILHEYTVQGLRTTSMCSDGFQRTTSTFSDASMNTDVTLPLKNLTELQRQSVDRLCDEIKWLLYDEICTTLLDTDNVTADMLQYVINHVVNGNEKNRISCKLDTIKLNFVYTTQNSHEKFLEEFQQLNLPFGYKLCQESDFYYVAKDDSKDSETYVNLSFTTRTSSTGELPVDLRDIFQSTSCIGSSCREETMSQQSEITSGSVGGTDGGYDEDVSEDDEDSDWLINLNNKRSLLPNFWLILKIDQDSVQLYFHCRFIELNTRHVEHYTEVERAVYDAIADLCKRVNQLLLLQKLYETKSCDPVLEPDDTTHNEVPVKNISYSKTRSFDADISDDSDMYSRSLSDASLNLKPGYFSCAVVWEKVFVLHPRLKTGPGNKSGISRGIMALKNILEKFSVSNRNNMFVYKDAEHNVFYLRLYESANLLNNNRKGDFDSSTVSRSSSIASLPLTQHKSNLAVSDQSLASLSSEILRPRVRSFGEKESRIYSIVDSKEKLNEDTLILRVHGITCAGAEVQCELVQVLQNRLDDAVLEFLSVTLARNSMCPLTPEDVRFIQKPDRPDFIIRLTVQKFALQWQNTNSFVYYLKQNLLQFLNTPKYTDNRMEFHFKDYTIDDRSVILPCDNIFIYNQSQPSSGSRGIACLVLALVSTNSGSNLIESENYFENVFIERDYENCVSSKIIGENDVSPDSFLEFRVWKQGRINIDNLSKKLASTVSQANWDIVSEYYLLRKPLSVEEYGENTVTVKKRVEIDALNLNLDKEIEYNCQIDISCDTHIRNTVKTSLITKTDAHHYPNRKYNKRSLHSSSLKASRVITYEPEADVLDNGVLSIVYSKFLPSWMEFGDQIKSSALKKHTIKLHNRHTPHIIVKELITLLGDSPKAFRALSTHALVSKSEDVFVPFTASNTINRYVIISRGFQKYQNIDDYTSDIPDALNPQNLKHSQKFVPTFIDGCLIPRQKMFWISVESDNIVIYTYNWAKEHIDKLMKGTMNLAQWLTLRSCFLNSSISQKIGLFYNQSLTRKCFMLSTNSYFSLIGHLDAMSRFPKDQSYKKIYQATFNLPMILEAFRDNFCNTKYTSTDALIVFTIEMKEMKSVEKRNRDEMKKLHSMYQSRTGSTSVPQLNLLMQNSRILHYVHTPLLFLPRWRLKSASTRNHSLYPSAAIQMADRFIDEEKELWHSELCYSFFVEYRNYLHTLGFTALQIDHTQAGPVCIWNKDKSSHNSVFYIQRTILGGILIFTVSFEEPFFVTKLHAIECNRLQNVTSRASVNGFTLSFLDECDKIKILMHLHSFTYDYHLRSIYKYISGSHGKLPEKYNVHQFLNDFMKYYNKAPNFATNLIHSDVLTIEHLVTEGQQLYDYLVRNVDQYGFQIMEIEDSSSEFILVQVTTARQVSYKDAQDRQRTDDFDMTLVVYNLCLPYKPTDKVLRLKYYLILTSKRETYPMFESEQKLGQFRTVSTQTTQPKPYDADSVLSKSVSLDETEQNVESTGESDEKSLRSTEEKPLKLFSNVTIMIECVNYLGYYSSHEQIMQKLILDKALSTQNDIHDMVSKGMVHCRTNLLWNRMITPQDSTNLSFNEFIELKQLAKLTPLCRLCPNLGPLLNQPVEWYKGLSKLLLVKYADQHRMFCSVDGQIVHYVILHPRYYGAFMMLSIDHQTARGELYAVFREPDKIEDTDPLGLGYEKSLQDGFVNCICFYLWSGMISN